jgi:prepilin peptidase CpaA
MELRLLDAALVVVVVVSAATDVWSGKIYNVVTYPAIVAGLIASLAGIGPPPLASVLGGLAGGGALYVMFACGWMGGGDVKLMAAVGTLSGLAFVLDAMFYAIFVGGVFAALVLIWRGEAGHVVRDFGALLGRGLGLTSQPVRIRPVGGSFPFGVAIAVGTVAAMVLQRLP